MSTPLRPTFTFAQTPTAPTQNDLTLLLTESQPARWPSTLQAHKDALEKAGYTGRIDAFTLLPSARLAVAGVDLPATLTRASTDPYAKLDAFTRGAQVSAGLAKTRYPRVVLTQVPPFFLDTHSNDFLLDFLLGFLHAATVFDHYRPSPDDAPPQRTLALTQTLHNALGAARRAKLVAVLAGLTTTRELIEQTPATLHPASVAPYLQGLFGSQAEIEILDAAALRTLGANALLAVGQASPHPPLVSKITLHPRQKARRTVVLVGKGVTYDAGGLDIKTGGHMHTMKSDLGGAATCAGVCRVLDALPLEHTRVVWFTGWVENVIAGNAYKADDILTTLSGQTVEVWNTDAEGRLTLADVLSLASLDNPDCIVDLATLTGAAIQALSPHYGALFGNDNELLQTLEKAFVNTGERVQTLPLPELLRGEVEGEWGQLRNTGKTKAAGHVTAALFLSHFVEQHRFWPDARTRLNLTSPQTIPWAHLDLAGPAYQLEGAPTTLRGATGYGVRALTSWLFTLDTQT